MSTKTISNKTAPRVKETYGEARVREQINNLSKQHGIRLEQALSALYLTSEGLAAHTEDALEMILDGSGDYGLDWYYIDDHSGQIVLGQTYSARSKGATIAQSKLNEFLNLPEQLSSLPLSKIRRKEVRNAIEKIQKALKTGASSVKLVFVTSGSLSNQNQERVSEFQDSSLYELEVYDLSRLSSLYHSSCGFGGHAVKSMKLSSGAGQWVEAPGTEHKTVIGFVEATEIYDLVNRYKEVMFGHNVRMGLGKTKVNKGIQGSLDNVERRSDFCALNGGIVAAAETALVDKDGNVILANASFINGQQTSLTIASYDRDLLKGVYLPIRIVETGKLEENSGFVSDLIRSNNTQNNVNETTFRSRDESNLILQETARSLHRPWFYDARGREWGSVSRYDERKALYIDEGIERVITLADRQGVAALRGYWKWAATGPSKIAEPENFNKVFPPDNPEANVHALIWSHEMGAALLRMRTRATADINKQRDCDKTVRQRAIIKSLGETGGLRWISILTMAELIGNQTEDKKFWEKYNPELGTQAMRDLLDEFAFIALKATVRGVDSLVDNNGRAADAYRGDNFHKDVRGHIDPKLEAILDDVDELPTSLLK